VTLEIIFEKDIKFWFQNSVPVLFLNGQALTEIFSRYHESFRTTVTGM